MHFLFGVREIDGTPHDLPAGALAPQKNAICGLFLHATRPGIPQTD
jgi:hypothetical protein